MKTRTMTTKVTILTFSVAAAVSIRPIHHASAAELRRDWATVDGGGSVSQGGSYTLTGTIGQPDAGRLFAGSFRLDGGFWPGLSIEQNPGGPLLKIQLVGPGQAILSWPVQVSGFTLEQCGPLGSSWSPVLRPVIDTATEHTVTLPASGPMKCYRLKQSQP